eukprot:1160074-Pelagomonas_calceolata.AAC.4
MFCSSPAEPRSAGSRVTSSAKKRREQGSTKISQTPDGSFYDLQFVHAALLSAVRMGLHMHMLHAMQHRSSHGMAKEVNG